MVDRFHAGADIVYGARNNRESDTLFKRLTATCYYKFLTKMGVEQVENHADFRLLSKRALNALLSFKERNIYIRGLVPLVGYSSDIVYYSRKERLAGESKYPLKKMLSLAWEGITSLSIKPLRLVSLLGICMSCLSLFGILYSLVVFLFGGTVQGWASVILAILLIGGIQLLATGVIGEYIGKIYIEVKDRPRFFISEDTDSKGNQ